jgi:hypothetical protein
MKIIALTVLVNALIFSRFFCNSVERISMSQTPSTDPIRSRRELDSLVLYEKEKQGIPNVRIDIEQSRSAPDYIVKSTIPLGAPEGTKILAVVGKTGNNTYKISFFGDTIYASEVRHEIYHIASGFADLEYRKNHGGLKPWELWAYPQQQHNEEKAAIRYELQGK